MARLVGLSEPLLASCSGSLKRLQLHALNEALPSSMPALEELVLVHTYQRQLASLQSAQLPRLRQLTLAPCQGDVLLCDMLCRDPPACTGGALEPWHMLSGSVRATRRGSWPCWRRL